MRRSDRLIEMVQILRDGRVHLARDIAARLQVTPRTVYRDMEALMTSGVPVRGTKGLGYAMTAPVTLPPLNLTMTELEALHLGLAIVGEGGDDDRRAAAASLSACQPRLTRCCRGIAIRRSPDGALRFIPSRMRPPASHTCPPCAPPFVPARNCGCTWWPRTRRALCARWNWTIGAGSGPSPAGAKRRADFRHCGPIGSTAHKCCQSCLWMNWARR